MNRKLLGNFLTTKGEYLKYLELFQVFPKAQLLDIISKVYFTKLQLPHLPHTNSHSSKTSYHIQLLLPYCLVADDITPF